LNQSQTACQECDLLIAVPDIRDGERADCPRCGTVITQRPRQGTQRALAFSLAACVFLAISMSYPFLSFSRSGIENVMTLPEAALVIYDERSPALAVIIFMAIIGAPAMLLAALLALTAPLVLKRTAPWLPRAGKLVFTLSEWSMAEVFIIGAIVSLVKIAKLATVVLGLAFWAYIIFTLCLTAALSGLDRFQVWRAIEARTA
jgi:paraquat-inducible protein A